LHALLAGWIGSDGIPDLPIAGIAMDSRQLQPGDVFAAVRGASGHGLQHADVAIQRGAVAVLAEGDTSANIPWSHRVPLIVAPDLRARLGSLARRAFGGSAGMRIVGVTGTNGKTSTVQFVAASAARMGAPAATQGTLGAGPVGATIPGERTTPDVCQTHRFLTTMAQNGIRVAAMEVSSHALDQGRVDDVPFDVAVFTQLTRDHLDYHGDMEHYFAAKAKLFAWPSLSAAVVNLDCEYGRRLTDGIAPTARTIGYSSRGAADATIAADHVRLDTRGIAFELRIEQQRLAVSTGLLGRFNVDNLLATASALLGLGYAAEQIAACFAELLPVPGRMNRIARDGAPTVVVDYAHTPDAIDVAIAALRAHQPHALSIVFGCGGERDRGKRPLMARAAQAADRVYVTDDNPRGEDGDQIVADILTGIDGGRITLVERDRRLAIERAIAEAAGDDIVLIAGKGHEPYQEIAGKKLPFDDATVARAALQRWAA
jgi:UDP-N-acetylmuramoyl-L-alanyl-D-glutamate--2,6-diaminopimelate ligase